MASISSGTFDARSGDGSITIDPDGNTSLPNTTMKVADIGVLEADYDLKDDSESANNVLFNLGEFRFDVFDRLGNGDSLFASLDSISSTTTIDVELDWTTNNGRSWEERFQFNTSNIEYDYESRKVTIESKYEFVLDETIGQIFGQDCSEVSLVGGFGESNTPSAPLCGLTPNGTDEIHCMTAEGFVNVILDNMNSSNTSVNGSEVAGGPVAPGSREFFVLGADATTSDYTRDQPAKDLFYRLAVADGAILGSYLGYNFFIKRLDTTNNVSITTADVESINVQPTLEDYFGVRNVFQGILNDSISGGTNNGTGWYNVLIGDDDGLNDDATKYTNIYFESNAFLLADTSSNPVLDARQLFLGINASLDEDASEGDRILSVDSSPSVSAGDQIFPLYSYDRSYEVASSTSNSITLAEPLRHDISSGTALLRFTDMNISEDTLDDSVNAYAKAYSADRDTRNIEISVFGLDTIKPYETFSLGSGFSTFLSGETFRPSKMTYDLKADKIKVKAYQIS